MKSGSTMKWDKTQIFLRTDQHKTILLFLPITISFRIDNTGQQFSQPLIFDKSYNDMEIERMVTFFRIKMRPTSLQFNLIISILR